MFIIPSTFTKKSIWPILILVGANATASPPSPTVSLSSALINSTMTMTLHSCSTFLTSTVVQVTTVTSVPYFMTMANSYYTEIPGLASISQSTVPLSTSVDTRSLLTSIPTAMNSTMMMLSNPTNISSIYPMKIPIPSQLIASTSPAQLTSPTIPAQPTSPTTSMVSSIFNITSGYPQQSNNLTMTIPSSMTFMPSPVTVTVTKCPKSLRQIASMALQFGQSIRYVTNVVTVKPVTETKIKMVHGFVPVITSVFTDAMSTVTVSQSRAVSSATTLTGSQLYWLESIAAANEAATQTLDQWSMRAWTSEWIISGGQTIAVMVTATPTMNMAMSMSTSVDTMISSMAMSLNVTNTMSESMFTTAWTSTWSGASTWVIPG